MKVIKYRELTIQSLMTIVKEQKKNHKIVSLVNIEYEPLQTTYTLKVS